MPTLTSELNRGPRELIRASKRVRYHLTKYVRGIFNPHIGTEPNQGSYVYAAVPASYAVVSIGITRDPGTE